MRISRPFIFMFSILIVLILLLVIYLVMVGLFDLYDLFSPIVFLEPSPSPTCFLTPQTVPFAPAHGLSPSFTESSVLSVPPPTYAPRSGRPITRCQGLIPEIKVSEYLGFALACLTNTTFEHEHICIDHLCDAVLVHVPDNAPIVKKYARQLAMRETGRHEERIPHMSTPDWLRCSHHYLPRGLLAGMAREHHRQRRNSLILWSLPIIFLIFGTTGTVYLYLYCCEPLAFAAEAKDAKQLKQYLLRKRIHLQIPGWLQRCLRLEAKVPIHWLDHSSWVLRKNMVNEAWFKDLERAFKARRRQQG